MKNRDNKFDFIKGILIILVVIGHAIQVLYGIDNKEVWYNPIFNIVYTFHMPLFIFISGYFFSSSLKYSFSILLEKKATRLLVPTFIWSTVILLIWGTATEWQDVKPFKVYTIYKSYWYLICIFVLTFTYYIIVKNKFIKLIILLIYIVSVIFYDYLPWTIFKDCQVIRQFAIFGLGILYQSKWKNLMAQSKFYKYIFLASDVFTIIGIRYFYGYNMMDFPPIIRIIDGICCSMLVFIILSNSYNPIKNNKIINGFVYLGKNSLAIYLIHVVAFRFIIYSGYTFEYNLISAINLTTILIGTSLFLMFIIKSLLKEKSYIVGV